MHHMFFQAQDGGWKGNITAQSWDIEKMTSIDKRRNWCLKLKCWLTVRSWMYSLSINPHTISSDRMNDYLKAMGRPEETLGKVTESKTFPTTTQIVKGLHSTQPHTMAELGSPLFTMSAHTAQGQGQRCILQQSAAKTYRSVHLRSTNTWAEHVLKPKDSLLQLILGEEGLSTQTHMVELKTWTVLSTLCFSKMNC